MPGMMKKSALPQKGGPAFKPCAKCSSPAKCKAVGQCIMKGKK